MNEGTKWKTALLNGQTLEYKIIGINHDDLADGSGKAGLTFMTTSTGIKSRMNVTKTNVGGWEASEIRQKMNSGEIWGLLPTVFRSQVKAVSKLTNNVGGTDKNSAVTATSDKLFLLSYSEIVASPMDDWLEYSWIGKEGTQYEAFQGKVTDSSNNYAGNWCLRFGGNWWERSPRPSSEYTTSFVFVDGNGVPAIGGDATISMIVFPVFCF